MVEVTEGFRQRIKTNFNEIGGYMYDKNTDSVMTFIIDKDVKNELTEYCKNNDVTKSQVLRDTVRTWLDFMKDKNGELTMS